MSAAEVQDGSRSWWTTNPMAYDWEGAISAQPLTAEWFDAIDARFLHGARLFATRDQPFDRIMPLSSLRNARVLEIGCGMGLHTEVMARAGAQVTAIDVTSTAVEATTRRLALKGLEATVRRIDAEQLPFDDATFDFVWSWGVIHHSAHTGRIVAEIRRVLKDDGSCRVMVYNRDGMAARVIWVKDFVLRGGFLGKSFDEVLWEQTDGFTARYYPKEQFADLFYAFFDHLELQVLGQDADVVPLPRPLRTAALKIVPRSYLERAQARRGCFLFLEASSPRR